MPAAKMGDTIVARATPAGEGGIAVVRISGPGVRAIASAVIRACPPPRRAVLKNFLGEDGKPLDSGLALYFPAPHSFTGEDVLELHGHGGSVLCRLLVDRIVALGARPAGPGEFSQRAFLNDRLDLCQAEAIADLIASRSAAAARAATRSLQGAFSGLVTALNEQITSLRVYVEAAIDFPDEEIDFLSGTELQQRITALRQAFDALEKTARRGALLRDGLQVVLAGPPNSGKSSLLNALAGYDAAIVSPIPGTTRDLVREELDLDGIPLRIIDTAGLRLTHDPVEQEGVRRTRAQLQTADLALLVVDATAGGEGAMAVHAEVRADVPAGVPVLQIRNKVDLTGEPPGRLPGATVNISALTGAGIEELRVLMREAAGITDPGEGTVTARQRHLDAVGRARHHFDAGVHALAECRAGELLAEELLQAQNALAEITGGFSSDELLGRIFAEFCIGK